VNAPKSSSELQYLLERLVTLHGNLIELLRQEYLHMGALDVPGLAEVTHAKEAVLNDIWSHEQLRIICVDNLAASLELGEKSASLLNIASALSEEDGEKLRAARTALNLLVSEAKGLNAKNMVFAESSLNRIEEMKKNAMGLNNTAVKENYSNVGTRQPIPEQGGRLLTTEA
jgi:flagellar biosynthesis/type III secretory pathway chaperone